MNELHFLDLPPEYRDPNEALIAILPVPYDRTSSWKRGADRGPAAIIEASSFVEWYDIETASEPHLHGIVTLPAIEFDGPPEELAGLVEAGVSGVLEKNQLPVVLGGEHSVSIGAVRALAPRSERFSVLQLDAHTDMRNSYQGSTHNHACVMARVREVCPFVQVGIRSLDAAEIDNLDEQRIFFAHEIAGNSDRSWMDRVVDLLSGEVHVTIDLDVFDPSIIPATGTPEPGGLSWYEVTELLRRVAKRRRVLGFDVVELCPSPEQHASAFTAAKLVYRFISMIYKYQ